MVTVLKYAALVHEPSEHVEVFLTLLTESCHTQVCSGTKQQGTSPGHLSAIFILYLRIQLHAQRGAPGIGRLMMMIKKKIGLDL